MIIVLLVFNHCFIEKIFDNTLEKNIIFQINNNFEMSNENTIKVNASYMQRFLHTRQPFPDNYIEDWFLSGMRLNYHVKVRSIQEVIKESLALLQTVSSVMLFNVIFFIIANEKMSIQPVYIIDIILFALCLISCIPLKISPKNFPV